MSGYKSIALVGLLSLIWLTSCGEKPAQPMEWNPRIKSAVEMSQDIQVNIKRGFLLKDATSENRRSIQSLIVDIRSALIRLNNDVTDPTSIRILDRSLEELKTLQILKIDEGTILSFISLVGEILTEVAKNAKVDVHSNTWNLFTYRFSEGLHPFASFSQGTQWDTDFNIPRDRNYAYIKNADDPSWLLSPRFDLSTVAEPSMRFSHIILADPNNRESKRFDRLRILRKAFTLWASTEYKEGDPESVDDWVLLDMGPLPASIDFDEVESPRIDLSRFAGKKLTLAFKYDRSSVGKHYLTWQILYFKLFGQSANFEYEEKRREIYRHDFNKETLKPFKVLQLVDGEAGESWEPSGFGSNRYDFAKVAATDLPTDSWLISPLYRLKDQKELVLRVSHVVRSPNLKNLRLLISEDYREGDPRLANWESFAVGAGKEIPEDTWVDLEFGPLDVSRYRGKDIIIAFQFVDDGRNRAVWEIKTIKINGFGEKISYQELEWD